MALITYPLNNVEYQAEDAELFHAVRTSGVFASDDFSVSASGQDNVVVVSPGIGWIANGKFSGKVIALKEDHELTLPVANVSLPRIDAVVIQFDVNANATNVVVKSGVASSSPVAPEVVRTESLYELHICHIRRSAGAISVSSSDIVDLRPDPNYCGFVSDEMSAHVLAITGGTMHGNIAMDGHKITGLSNPTAEMDAVNKAYADKIAGKIVSAGARFEFRQVTVRARETAELEFSGNVQAVLVGLQLKTNGAINTAVWGRNMSGITQHLYGEIDNTEGAWKTMVTFEENRVTIYRDGSSTVVYYVTAILPAASSINVSDDGEGNVTIG